MTLSEALIKFMKGFFFLSRTTFLTFEFPLADAGKQIELFWSMPHNIACRIIVLRYQ